MSDKEKQSIVDCHVHALPGWMLAAFHDWLRDTGSLDEGPPVLWPAAALGSADSQTASLDEHDIDMALLTYSSNTLRAVEAARGGVPTEKIIDRLNTEMRGWTEQTGGRVRACCWADPRYPDSAITEVGRASEDGGVPAISVLTAYQDLDSGALRFLDDSDFEPVLAAAEQANVAVFVHASAKYNLTSQPPLPASAESYLRGTLGMLVENTLCLTRMVYAGVFDRHPGLQVVFGQLGGVFPFALGRFDLVQSAFAKMTDATGNAGPVLRKLSDYVGSIYVDTHSMDRPAIECALEVLGPSRLLFGSDYPVTPEVAGRARGLTVLRSLGLDDSELDAVLAANAVALLGL